MSLKRAMLILVLVAASLMPMSCKKRVVVGRSAQRADSVAEFDQAPDKKSDRKVAEKSDSKPDVKPESKSDAKSSDQAKPAVKIAGTKSEKEKFSMNFNNRRDTPSSSAKTSDVKPSDAKSDTKPQPTPAATKDVSSSKTGSATTKDAVASPYKLDLSFGGFGLGSGLFDTPVNVAVDEQENIYVVDQGNNRIQKFDRFGMFQFSWGRQGMGDGEFVEQNNVLLGQVLRLTGEFEFNKPIGMTLDTDDTRDLIRIHIVDSLNNRIQRFLITRNLAEAFPSGAPQNVFKMLTKKGNVDDTGPDSLEEKYQRESRQVILDPVYLNDTPGKANSFILAPYIWGGLGYTQGQLNIPTYCTIDPVANVLYVSDTENGRVEGFYITPLNPSTDTTFFREWGNDINMTYGAGRLKAPTAIAFDSIGFGGFLVLDKLQNGGYNIQRFDRDGNFVSVFASSGEGDGQFKQPVSMAINTFDNTVFITDRAKKKIMAYNNKGDFMYEFGGDELADPRGITILRNGYVYVTDAAKNMVYKYVPR